MAVLHLQWCYPPSTKGKLELSDTVEETEVTLQNKVKTVTKVKHTHNIYFMERYGGRELRKAV